MRIHKIRPAKLFIYTVIRLDIRYDASERLIWLMLRVNCLTIVGPGHGANRKQRSFARYRRPTRLWELWGQPQHPIHRFRGVDEKKTKHISRSEYQVLLMKHVTQTNMVKSIRFFFGPSGSPQARRNDLESCLSAGAVTSRQQTHYPLSSEQKRRSK